MPPGTPWTIELERESVLRSPSLEGRRADEWRELWFGHSNQGAPPVLLYERVGSTNTIARQLAEQGAPDRTIIIADEQSAGRGRGTKTFTTRSEEHTSELQSRGQLVCRLLREKKKAS